MQSTSTSVAAPTPLPTTRKEAEHLYATSVVRGRSLRPAHIHPKTHNIPVATIQFRSYHPRLLDLFIHFTSHAAAALAIPVSRTVCLPTQRSLWTVPRGPFAHKKSQENFERKVHKRAIKAWDADHEVVERWIKYLEEHPLEGVGIRVTRWQRAPVGIGAQVLDKVTEQMRLESVSSREKVKALGEQIIKEELAATEEIPAVSQPPKGKPS